MNHDAETEVVVGGVPDFRLTTSDGASDSAPVKPHGWTREVFASWLRD